MWRCHCIVHRCRVLRSREARDSAWCEPVRRVHGAGRGPFIEPGVRRGAEPGVGRVPRRQARGKRRVAETGARLGGLKSPFQIKNACMQ